jgi:RES domain-containing protein
VILEAFRIIKRARASTCFDGEGARLFGGRWNSKGVRLVYTSSTQSLAILETLVHLDSHEILAKKYCVRVAQFDAKLCERLDRALLPGGWDEDIPINATKDIGDAWIKTGRSAVLIVPSSISPLEENYLLNPAHPDFRLIRFSAAKDFVFSRRLLK